MLSGGFDAAYLARVVVLEGLEESSPISLTDNILILKQRTAGSGPGQFVTTITKGSSIPVNFGNRR